MCVLFRRCHRLPVGPQQEADDLLSERTSAAARETGLLLSHVSTDTHTQTHTHSHPLLVSAVLLFLHLFSNEPLSFFYLCVWSGPVSLRQPALCHTSSVSLTLGPSLSVTHPPSSSAPSTTSLHCCPVKRSSYPGEKWSWIWDGRMASVVLSKCCLPNESFVYTQHPTRTFGTNMTHLAPVYINH